MNSFIRSRCKRWTLRFTPHIAPLQPKVLSTNYIPAERFGCWTVSPTTGQPYQSWRKKPWRFARWVCISNRWKYGGLMVSQGAKVLVVNEYSMKSSKRSLTSSVYFPLEGVSPFTNPKSKNRIVHGMVTQIHCVGEVPCQNAFNTRIFG